MTDLIEEFRGQLIAQALNDAVSVSRLSKEHRQAAMLVVADLLEATWPYRPSYSRTVGKKTATAYFTPEARALQSTIPETNQQDRHERERIMRVRINTHSLRRELNKLRGSKKAARGVMLVPGIASSIEEFEAVAVEQQAKLMNLTMDDHNGAEFRNSLQDPITADQGRVVLR